MSIAATLNGLVDRRSRDFVTSLACGVELDFAVGLLSRLYGVVFRGGVDDLLGFARGWYCGPLVTERVGGKLVAAERG